MNYLLIAAAYLIGSIPFGLVFGKLAGIDVRTSGSGNIGATNVSRLVGKKMGVLTLVADVGKGFLPMMAAAWFLREAQTGESVVLYCGAATFLGHLFPIYLKFKGGKGVATALGVFLYLDPVAVLIALAAFIVAVFASGYISVGSLAAAALFPGISWYLGTGGSQLLLAGFVSILIWAKHHENIVRLLKQQEHKNFRKSRRP